MVPVTTHHVSLSHQASQALAGLLYWYINSCTIHQTTFIGLGIMRKSAFLFMACIILLLLIGPHPGIESKENPDPCVICHADPAKMKAWITRFPEPSAEEGEG